MPRRRAGRPRAGAVDATIARALAEDRADRDRTSRAVVPTGTRLTADLVAQARGTVSGLAVVGRLARRQRLAFQAYRHDGDRVVPGTRVATITGDARRVLGAERTALNFLMHLSGVATATAAAVRRAGGRMEVRATRKTLPGLRSLEKAAVVHGGGAPHRADLAERILVKSTHVALVGLGPAVARARARARRDETIEVEVRTAPEAIAAVRAGARAILVDNAGPAGARRVVRALEGAGLRRGVVIELSGGIRGATVARYRSTGADAVSLGDLTHSAPALPFHLVVRTTRRRRPAPR